MFTVDDYLRTTIVEHFRRNKAFTWTEDFFLFQISDGKSKYDVYWSTLALRDCGTERSIAAVKALSTYPMQDIRDSAILTIAQISGAAETPYFVERLIDPKGRNRAYPIWAIGTVGDERAIPAIVQYVRKNAKKLSAATHDSREQQEILAFLHRVNAEALLKEFAFLAAALRTLPPAGLSQFLERVPGIQEIIEVPGT